VLSPDIHLLPFIPAFLPFPNSMVLTQRRLAGADAESYDWGTLGRPYRRVGKELSPPFPATTAERTKLHGHSQ